MVSLLERSICYTSLACLYGWGFYKYNSTQKTINDVLFEKVKTNALKYMESKSHENLKFVNTFNKKILFIIGIENNNSSLRSLKDFNELTENFVFDHMMIEKQIMK